MNAYDTYRVRKAIQAEQNGTDQYQNGYPYNWGLESERNGYGRPVDEVSASSCQYRNGNRPENSFLPPQAGYRHQEGLAQNGTWQRTSERERHRSGRSRNGQWPQVTQRFSQQSQAQEEWRAPAGKWDRIIAVCMGCGRPLAKPDRIRGYAWCYYCRDVLFPETTMGGPDTNGRLHSPELSRILGLERRW